MRLVLWLWLGVAAVANSAAQTPPTVRVALAGSAPFVMGTSEAPGGFAVDLWQSIATQNNWKSEIQGYPSTDAALAAVTAGRADVVVGNTSIIRERLAGVDFSQPFYRAGFQIMVSEGRGKFSHVVRLMSDPLHLWVFGLLALAVLAGSLAVAIFERRHNPDFPKEWPAGLAEAFYYVMGLVTGKSAYKGFPGVLGRVVLVGWMVASLVIVSYVTSVITTAMTVATLRGQINGPGDLPGRTVGAVEGTAVEDYLRNEGITYVAYRDMPSAVQALVAHKIEAIVGDAPVLQYYDYTHPRDPISEVGPIFDPVNYGFAVPKTSGLRVAINASLLELEANGYFEALGAKYFGSSYQK